MGYTDGKESNCQQFDDPRFQLRASSAETEDMRHVIEVMSVIYAGCLITMSWNILGVGRQCCVFQVIRQSICIRYFAVTVQHDHTCSSNIRFQCSKAHNPAMHNAQ